MTLETSVDVHTYGGSLPTNRLGGLVLTPGIFEWTTLTPQKSHLSKTRVGGKGPS